MIRSQSLDLSSPYAFLIVSALALIDGVVPLVPARTAVIGLGVLAGTGDRRAYPLLALATVAAFVSDNISYWIGRRYWARLSNVIFRGARARRVWTWVELQIRRKGTALVVVARVIPGGPTPITLTAGSVGLPRARFRLAAAAGALLWSAYAFSVGMFGDAVSGHQPLVGLAVALTVAGAVNLVLRRLLHRHTADSGGDGSDQAATDRRRP